MLKPDLIKFYEQNIYFKTHLKFNIYFFTEQYYEKLFLKLYKNKLLYVFNAFNVKQ